MTAAGPAARVLGLLAAAEPLYFSSFYRRARLFRQRPRPVPAAAVLDLTSQCPLACAFCFAAATEHSQRSLDLAQLSALEEEFSGLPHLQIVGGEPLTHPQWPAIARLLGRHHRRIDVYTSGVSLPLARDKRRAWLARMFGDAAARFSLTVAVDRYHRDQLGPARFAALIDALAELAEARDSDQPAVRWNVTDPALHTTGYLTVDTVQAVLAALHPALPRLWQRSLAAGDFDEVWQFNPVVRMGRASDAAGELLRAEDALWDPEVVLSPDGRGGVRWLGLLPATWMAEVPAGLELGHSAGEGGLAAQLWQRLVAPRLGLDPHGLAAALGEDPGGEGGAVGPARAGQDSDLLIPYQVLHGARHVSDAAPGLRRLRRAALQRQVEGWPVQRQQRLDEAAARLWAICGAGGQAWDLGCDRRLRRLPAPLLRRYAGLWLQHRPEHAEGWLAELAQRAIAPWQDGALPAFLGYRARPGLLTDPPDEPVPLRRAPLDLGVAAPHLGDALLRPRLSPAPWVDADGRLHLTLDGLGEAALGPHVAPAELEDALAVLWPALGYFVPAALAAAWRQRLEAAVAQALTRPFWRGAEAQGWAEGVRRALASAVAVPDEPTETPGEVWKLLAGEAEAAPIS